MCAWSLSKCQNSGTFLPKKSRLRRIKPTYACVGWTRTLRLCAAAASRYSPGLFSAGIRGQTPTSALKRVALTSTLLSWNIRFLFFTVLRGVLVGSNTILPPVPLFIYFRDEPCFAPSVPARCCCCCCCDCFWKESLVSSVRPPPSPLTLSQNFIFNCTFLVRLVSNRLFFFFFFTRH